MTLSYWTPGRWEWSLIHARPQMQWLGLQGLLRVYVFVLLNKPGEAVQYFIVPGQELVQHPERFSKYFFYSKMPGIHPKTFQELGYENAWGVFDESAS